VRAAPDPALAAPVAHCHADEPLDNVIPFSSLILLGVVVAVEDRFGVVVTREQLSRACEGGSSLRKLAHMIEAQQSGRANRDASSQTARTPEHTGA
jgi:acyl carrier protein